MSNLKTGCLKSGIAKVVIQSATIPKGIFTIKIQCHDKVSTKIPPIVGPKSGPINPGMVMKLITFNNSLFG